MTMSQPAFERRLFVSSDIYRRPAYGTNHPLAIPRLETVMDLCDALGWFPDGSYHESPVASAEQLAWFHHPGYVEALRTADAAGRATPGMRERYGLGTIENPIFKGVFARASTSVGGSIEAARLVAEAPGVAFHPAGGTHHAAPDRARGFCFFNDPVFGILALKRAGIGRILYVDLDAHHGDGVENAFIDDDTVLTVSIHEVGRWPYSGCGERPGAQVRNLPVSRGFNDSELAFLMEDAVLPAGRDFAPDAVVVTCGADGLKGDPLSSMALSNGALWRAAEAAAALADRAVILGGGGYNPWTVARGWAGLWGWLNRFDTAAPLPPAARAILRRLDCDLVDEEDIPAYWFETIVDPPNEGAVRAAVRACAAPARPLRQQAV
ncbi:MAG: acetoin utilization protein AcuC [Alphaproteobacteria bacterium]|nr:acetoin utilization protein AcuC [Alphaproteobacteria bacterium]